jgi:hypothetical protein
MDYEDLIKNYAEHTHDFSCFLKVFFFVFFGLPCSMTVLQTKLIFANKFENGWSYGELYDDASKTHPILKSYSSLPKKV